MQKWIFIIQGTCYCHSWILWEKMSFSGLENHYFTFLSVILYVHLRLWAQAAVKKLSVYLLPFFMPAVDRHRQTIYEAHKILLLRGHVFCSHSVRQRFCSIWIVNSTWLKMAHLSQKKILKKEITIKPKLCAVFICFSYSSQNNLLTNIRKTPLNNCSNNCKIRI